MKTAIRLLALSVVVLGGAAAANTHKSATAVVSHQSASSMAPTPTCGPYMPGCGADSN